MNLSALLVALPPVLLAATLQETTITPVDDAVRQIINLGVGGVVAAIFYWQWQREREERKAAEKRERNLLRNMAQVEPESESANGDKPP